MQQHVAVQHVPRLQRIVRPVRISPASQARSAGTTANSARPPPPTPPRPASGVPPGAFRDHPGPSVARDGAPEMAFPAYPPAQDRPDTSGQDAYQDPTAHGRSRRARSPADPAAPGAWSSWASAGSALPKFTWPRPPAISRPVQMNSFVTITGACTGQSRSPLPPPLVTYARRPSCRTGSAATTRQPAGRPQARPGGLSGRPCCIDHGHVGRRRFAKGTKQVHLRRRHFEFLRDPQNPADVGGDGDLLTRLQSGDGCHVRDAHRLGPRAVGPRAIGRELDHGHQAHRCHDGAQDPSQDRARCARGVRRRPTTGAGPAPQPSLSGRWRASSPGSARQLRRSQTSSLAPSAGTFRRTRPPSRRSVW